MRCARVSAGSEETPRTRNSSTPSMSTGAVAMTSSAVASRDAWACTRPPVAKAATTIRNRSAMRLFMLIRQQPLLSENPARPLDEFVRRWFDGVERVRDVQLLPLEPAHLMKRENVDARDAPQIRGERCGLRDILRVVRQTRYEDVSQPDRTP